MGTDIPFVALKRRLGRNRAILSIALCLALFAAAAPPAPRPLALHGQAAAAFYLYPSDTSTPEYMDLVLEKIWRPEDVLLRSVEKRERAAMLITGVAYDFFLFNPDFAPGGIR